MADCRRAISRSTGSAASAGKRDRDGGFLVAMARAMIGTIGPFAVAICRQSMRAEDSLCGGARLGDHHGGGLDRDEGGRRIGPFGLDDREGAGGAQRFDEVGRRTVGDHDHRTLQRHGGRTQRYKMLRDPNGGLLIPRQRQCEDYAALSWPRGRNAPAISGLTPRACNSAAVAARSRALPARR